MTEGRAASAAGPTPWMRTVGVTPITTQTPPWSSLTTCSCGGRRTAYRLPQIPTRSARQIRTWSLKQMQRGGGRTLWICAITCAHQHRASRSVLWICTPHWRERSQRRRRLLHATSVHQIHTGSVHRLTPITSTSTSCSAARTACRPVRSASRTQPRLASMTS